ncbi:MAG TPA: BlaI/MecI/CopY family transcriptional regulator [Phenylobacterium sp.]|jgi:predicted transcriptional regulator|nr:BlaI/MecI/CopY family transcriptional regulator [Phenylobacterium sp.]
MADVFRPSRSGPAAVLGPLEGEIMEVVWATGGTVSVPDVHRRLTEAGRAISYSAVKAVLNNLAGKGRLAKTREGKATFFAAAATREEFEAQVVSTVVRSLKRNFGPAVIAQLVDELAVDQATLSEFERVIAQRKTELKS